MADPLVILLQRWGWAGVVLYIAVRELWPVVKDHLIPSYVQDRKRRAEAEVAEVKRRVDEERTYRVQLANFQERQVRAFEQVAEAVGEIRETLASFNDRLGHVERDLTVIRAERPTRPRKPQQPVEAA
jgi:NifB/MoaA-like Fe-S oxidoreductase